MNIIYLKERVVQNIHAGHSLISQNIVTNARHIDSLAIVQERLTRARVGELAVRS